MRADIHDGREHNALQAEAGYIDARQLTARSSAARYAQRCYGAERVPIVDFDAHHGNGSQQIFWSDRTVMYCSTHEMPLFPGTGAMSERGEHDNIVNAPLRAGDWGETFREALDTAILPRLQKFAPDLIVISAGFDAHRLDPLANLNLLEADFG